MGLSSRAEDLIHIEEAQKQSIPIIRRYSGGGTVFVDHNTIFVTFIGAGKKFPNPLLEEGARHLSPCFPEGFALRDHDYVIGNRKVGGNAQYLAAQRWAHHISFLWDYDPKKMNILKKPKKQPPYRQDRLHADFVVPLCSYFSCRESWIESLTKQLHDSLPAKLSSLPSPPWNVPSRLTERWIPESTFS